MTRGMLQADLLSAARGTPIFGGGAGRWPLRGSSRSR